MEHPVDAPEYPSPVSVLDVAADMDDSPSPVKHTKKALRGNIFFCTAEIEVSFQYRKRDIKNHKPRM